MAQVPVVVGHKYVSPQSSQFSVTRKVLSVSGGDFAISDDEGQILFRVEGKRISLHDKKVLLGADNAPVISLGKKLLALHTTWEAHRVGDANELLYSLKKGSGAQDEQVYDIFLQGQVEPVFHAKGDIVGKKYDLYFHEHIIARIGASWFSLSKLTSGSKKYGVKIEPNVDQAFVASVIALMESISKDSSGDSSSSDSD